MLVLLNSPLEHRCVAFLSGKLCYDYKAEIDSSKTRPYPVDFHLECGPNKRVTYEEFREYYRQNKDLFK